MNSRWLERSLRHVLSSVWRYLASDWSKPVESVGPQLSHFLLVFAPSPTPLLVSQSQTSFVQSTGPSFQRGVYLDFE